jgi:saccharopine dehydrogenase-like NADP-dependent oxidoreductase
MKAKKEKELEEKSPIFGTALGDIGVVVIAALCTITLILILFSPSPFEKLEKAQARQEKEKAHQVEVARQKRIDEAVATGEVSVGIMPKRH